MNLVQRWGSTVWNLGRSLLKRSASAVNAVVNVFSGLSGGRARNGGGWLKAFRTGARLQAVVARIAEDVASSKLRVYEVDSNGEERETMKGDLVAWLRRPWKTMGGGSLWSLLFLSIVWFELLGEIFWLIRKDPKTGRVIEVWPIPATWVASTPNDDPGGGYTLCLPGYKVRDPITGQPKNLIWVPPSEMLWIARPNPENPFARGAARAAAVDDEVTQEELANKFENSFWRNHARPDVAVFLEGLEDDTSQIKKLRDQWEEQHRGALNAYRPAFLPANGKLQQVQGNLIDLALKEIRDLHRDVIWQLWGIPPEILGALQNSNKATIQAADYHYSLRVLLPRLTFLEGELNHLFAPLFGPNLVLRFDNPVRETAEFTLEKETEMWVRGGTTRNEYRIAMGKKPFPPGDPRGEEILVPSNSALQQPDGKLVVVSKGNDSAPTPAEQPTPHKKAKEPVAS